MWVPMRLNLLFKGVLLKVTWEDEKKKKKAITNMYKTYMIKL